MPHPLPAAINLNEDIQHYVNLSIASSTNQTYKDGEKRFIEFVNHGQIKKQSVQVSDIINMFPLKHILQRSDTSTSAVVSTESSKNGKLGFALRGIVTNLENVCPSPFPI